MTTTEVVLVLAAIVVASIVKGVTGLGLPLVAIPPVSLIVGLDAAVVIVALPNLILNAVMTWQDRAHLPETRDLPVLAIAGVVGSVVGANVLLAVGDEPLVILVAVAVAAYVVLFITVPDLAVGPATSRRLAPIVGLGGGFLHGSTGISGPVIGTWLHAYRLDRDAYVVSLTSLFFLASAAQVTVLTARQAERSVWWLAGVAIVPAVAALPLGNRFRGRIDARRFDVVIISLLAVATAILVARTVA